MLSILKVLLTFAGEHKLKLSMTHIEHLTAQLITALIIGMFLTTLAAIAVAVGAFVLYQGLIVSGFSASLSAIAVAFLILVILGICVNRLSYYTKSIRAEFKSIAHIETPVVGPVVGQVSNVAQSFMSGLLHSQNRKKLEASPKAERRNSSLVRTRSL